MQSLVAVRDELAGLWCNHKCPDTWWRDLALDLSEHLRQIDGWCSHLMLCRTLLLVFGVITSVQVHSEVSCAVFRDETG